MDASTSRRLTARTVYPTRKGAFPAATFFDGPSELDYMREVQAEYSGTFGICSCPARSYEMHQTDVRESASGRA